MQSHEQTENPLNPLLNLLRPVSPAAAQKVEPDEGEEGDEPIKPFAQMPMPAPGRSGGPVQRVVPPTPLLQPDQVPSAVLRGFAGPKSSHTWQSQMVSRGWTGTQLEEAIQSGQRFSADNRVNSENGATRYVHPQTGRSVVIDDLTGQVIQLGGSGFGYER